MQLRVSKGVTTAQINAEFLKILSELYGSKVADTAKMNESVVINRGGYRFQRIALDGRVFAFRIGDFSCVFHEGKRILCIDAADNTYLPRFLPFFSDDGGFVPSDDFYECDERVERILKNIAAGKLKTVLPVIVVSACDNWELPVDPGRLAKRVMCRAHVVAVNDVAVAHQLDACKIRSGAITVLNPSPLLYRLDAYESEDVMLSEIEKVLSIGRSVYPATWMQVLEEKTNGMIHVYEETNTDEHDELIHTLEHEVENWKDKYANIERKCASLQAELNSLKKSSTVTEKGILNRGKETDYYQDEAKELIIKTLKKAIPNEAPRVRDVLMDIVENNPIENNGEKLREEIRSIFRTDAGINERCKNSLIRAGFSIKSDGKHHKVIWHDDQRYITTMAKTASTHRAADDEALTILQQILGN